MKEKEEKALTMHEKWDLDSKSEGGGVGFTGEKRKSKEPVKMDEATKKAFREMFGTDL